MEPKKTKKLIKSILRENQIEVGIFISLLSYEYMQSISMSKDEFLKHLKNSLDIIEKGE